MAGRKGFTTRNATRALARIEEKGTERATKIAQFIVEYIALNPKTPYDDTDPRGIDKPESQHLRNSYYVRIDPETGDALIKSRRRYWAFVEFGTRRRNYKDRQPHVRPAIEAARAVFK